MWSIEKETKVLVVGLGRSGIAALRFLSKMGVDVTGTDMKSLDDLALQFGEFGGKLNNDINGSNKPMSPKNKMGRHLVAALLNLRKE